MSSAKCRMCGRYWSYTTKLEHDVITKWCPICIPKILPLAGAEVGTGLPKVRRPA